MTEGNKDNDDMRKVIGNRFYRKDMANKFKQEDGDFKIAIVVDMLLTGLMYQHLIQCT